MIIPIPIYYNSGGLNIPINQFTLGLLIFIYFSYILSNIYLLSLAIKNKIYIVVFFEIIVIIISLLPLSLLFN